MLSFPKLGSLGRLGNQLFQYAYIRTRAEALGTTFFCPKWIGDDVLNLNDSHLRENAPCEMKYSHSEKPWRPRHTVSMSVPDSTEVTGFFEGSRYFSTSTIKECYSFRKDKVRSVCDRYSHIDFSECLGIHVRLTDKTNQLQCYSARPHYYKKAMDFASLRCQYRGIVLFSDDLLSAEKLLAGAGIRSIPILNNADWEDLYLMTQCRSLICSASTLSWWAAWLNQSAKKIIVYPKHGLLRPHYRQRNFVCPEWHTVPGITMAENLIDITWLSFKKLCRATSRIFLSGRNMK
jgi:hypothetical protein